MDYTSRMVALLGRMRRERNGAVADAMRFYGAAYGLNYGVSLPTLRQIARAESLDHDFARYLFRQEVRELRLAALHIAQPERLTLAGVGEWAAGIVNSEVAEEAAFALFSRAESVPELFRAWTSGGDPLLQYAALLAAARSPLADVDWAATAVEVVRRAAESAARAVRSAEPDAGPVAQPDAGPASVPAAESAGSDFSESAVSGTTASDGGTAASPCSVSAAEPAGPAGPAATARTVPPPAAAHLVAQGAVALLAALGSGNEENRQAVLRAAGSLGKLPAEDFVHEELAWRLEA